MCRCAAAEGESERIASSFRSPFNRLCLTLCCRDRNIIETKRGKQNMVILLIAFRMSADKFIN